MSPPWEEFHRQRRLVDQMMTMHALLRDRYRRRRLSLLLGTLALAVLGAGFAFASNAGRVTIAGISGRRDTWLGVLSLAILFLTVTDLVTDWAGRSREHKQAVSSLARLKAEFRDVPSPVATTDVPPPTLAVRYNDTMDSLPGIPERAFNPLKARHLRKVAVSRQLSASPGAPAWLIMVRVIRAAARK